MSTLIREAPLIALTEREAVRVSYPKPGALSLTPTVTLACISCPRALAFTHTTPHMSIIAQRAVLADWDVTQAGDTVIVTCPAHTEQHTKVFHQW